LKKHSFRAAGTQNEMLGQNLYKTRSDIFHFTFRVCIHSVTSFSKINVWGRIVFEVGVLCEEIQYKQNTDSITASGPYGFCLLGRRAGSVQFCSNHAKTVLHSSSTVPMDTILLYDSNSCCNMMLN